VRLLPQSVNGRVFAALVLAVVLINLTSLFFYVVFRDETAAAAAASQAADQIIVIKRVVERAPREDQPALIQRLSSPLMNLRITQPKPIVEKSDNTFASRVVLDKLRKVFPQGTDIRVDSRIELRGFQSDLMPLDEAIRLSVMPIGGITQPSVREDLDPETQLAPAGQLAQQQPASLRELFQRRANQRMIALRGGLPALDEALFNVSIRTPDMSQQAWFNARVLLNLGEPQGEYIPFFWLTAFCIIIGVVAWWGVQRATKPLSVFAHAAERLGVDVNAEPLPEDGPSEVRRATNAFNTMQMRIRRFIQDRTQMLAAISHDLRTPITRLRLRAEFIDDDVQREKMLNDLDEMEAMIGSTLAFARDDAANEPVASVDVAAIVASLCGDHRAAGRDVTYSGPDSLEMMARPLAFKRAINNFVDNAIKYGKNANVTLQPNNEDLLIYIDDEGPGIPPSEKERVFAPFIRLESSRSRETGGTGLGLTIARNAIRSMGGDVDLINRPEGGLRVVVSLPMAQEDILAAAAE
jgi:signal transduction histidine kinase